MIRMSISAYRPNDQIDSDLLVGMETPWNVLRVFHDPSMTVRLSGSKDSVIL